jgi:hypothetical protein
MQKNTNIDKKIPATTRAAGYYWKRKVSNSGGVVKMSRRFIALHKDLTFASSMINTACTNN